jgi:AraC-like DNA-binding protein
MEEILNKILGYIEEHLYEKISLDDLSALSFYSKSYLSREFNKILGLSIPDYITRRRLSNAAIMIFETDKQINFIANVYGFNSVKYFSFSFKKHFGVCPSEYRNKTNNILLYPKRHLKGGEIKEMRKLGDLDYEVELKTSDNDEYTIIINTMEIKGKEVTSIIELQDNGNVKITFN